jgi:hypothetical protein
VSDVVESAEDGAQDDEADLEERSFLTQFRPELFIEHRGWRSLKRILTSRGGGSYGLAGPRGGGKTWMMEKALAEARENEGMGVWFPSPSEYEPTAFLAALSDVVAARYEEFYDKLTGRLTRAAFQRNLLLAMGGTALAYTAIVLLVSGAGEWLASSSVPLWFSPLNAFLLLAAIAGLTFVVMGFRGARRDRKGLGRLRRSAEELRRQVRYTVNATEGTELGLDGGFSGVKAGLKRVRTNQLVERPATLSSLIHNFRAFVEGVAEVVNGPVVIAIDELDKMSDAERVGQLFRDIKGIFEIPGAYFLVSLSDEAARALGLGAVRGRNEFNSSFYTVISLPPLPPAECAELLIQRNPDFDRTCGLAIGVLTGGVSREVARVAEAVRSEGEEDVTVEMTVRLALALELEAFAAQALETESGDGDAERARVRFFDFLEEVRVSLDAPQEVFSATLRAGWDLNHDSTRWQGGLNEEWRRLLVRLAVGWLLAACPAVLDEEIATAELQSIVSTTATSATVGRLRLEAFMAAKGLSYWPAVPAGAAEDGRVG